MKSSVYYRIRLGVFAAFALLTPFVVVAAHLAVKSNSNNVADWLPDSFKETQELQWFSDHFGTDAILMISWDGCTLDDPRAAALANQLKQPAGLGGVHEVQLFDRVLHGQELLEQLQQPPLSLADTASHQRLEGWILGADRRTTCVLAVISNEGWEYSDRLLDHIQHCAAQIPELPIDSIHVAGSVLDSVEIDKASNQLLVPLTIASFSICFLLMYGVLRSLSLSLIVFVNALLCQQMSLAVVYLSGTRMDSILLMVPMLIFVLSVSGGVHLVNYYRDAVIEEGQRGATSRAIRAALAPCWLASATTALGLISLFASELLPVERFGLFASFAVILGTLVLFTLLPCQLEQTSPRFSSAQLPSGRLADPEFRHLLRFVSTGRYAILLVAFSLTGIGIYGVTRLQAGVRIHDLFSPQAKILRDYDWLEERIGPLVPLEIVIRLPREAEATGLHPALKRLQLVSSIHQAAAGTQGIGAVVSAWNFCPPLDALEGRSTSQVVRRAVINKKLEASRAEYAKLGMLVEAADEELWRVSARAYAGHDLDYAEVLADLQAAVQPVLHQAEANGLAGIGVVYCGGVPLVQKAQAQMLSDLINSFLSAFGFIGIVMALLMIVQSIPELHGQRLTSAALTLVRGVTAGILAMVPNVLPCVLVLGAIGMAGGRIEIGSMMTASVALGIAVDDTLHYLTWYRRGRKTTNSRYEAVAFAYRKCGVAMIQTSVICGVGLLVYALSPFVPVARFAWVMSSMLTLALVADLLVLPAILLSPLGVVFEPWKLPHREAVSVPECEPALACPQGPLGMMRARNQVRRAKPRVRRR